MPSDALPIFGKISYIHCPTPLNTSPIEPREDRSGDQCYGAHYSNDTM
ncbi:MAG: hypothetical protein ACI8XO_001936 [Verrucomicrobiales bacterium]|jgi:hypothetical protein